MDSYDQENNVISIDGLRWTECHWHTLKEPIHFQLPLVEHNLPGHCIGLTGGDGGCSEVHVHHSIIRKWTLRAKGIGEIVPRVADDGIIAGLQWEVIELLSPVAKTEAKFNCSIRLAARPPLGLANHSRPYGCPQHGNSEFGKCPPE
eukprot:6326453-Amphidinium_carterae.2